MVELQNSVQVMKVDDPSSYTNVKAFTFPTSLETLLHGNEHVSSLELISLLIR